MELLEKMKTEYMLMKLPTTPVNKYDVAAAIDIYLYGLDESEYTVTKAYKKNNFDFYVQSIKNLFLTSFGYYGIDLEFFEKDDEVLDKHLELSRSFKTFFNALNGAITDDNYLDIYKLVVFTQEKYNSNFNYLEDLRDRLRYAYCDGITYCGFNYTDDSKMFYDFFEEEFKRITSTKSIEKVKNM